MWNEKTEMVEIKEEYYISKPMPLFPMIPKQELLVNTNSIQKRVPHSRPVSRGGGGARGA